MADDAGWYSPLWAAGDCIRSGCVGQLEPGHHLFIVDVADEELLDGDGPCQQPAGESVPIWSGAVVRRWHTWGPLGWLSWLGGRVEIARDGLLSELERLRGPLVAQRGEARGEVPGTLTCFGYIPPEARAV